MQSSQVNRGFHGRRGSFKFISENVLVGAGGVPDGVEPLDWQFGPNKEFSGFLT